MTFRAPVRDLAYALTAVGHSEMVQTAFPDLDDDTVMAVLEAAGELATNELAPLNRVGDLEGARLENGKVVLPSGFAEAFHSFAEGGWTGLAASPDFGGQGLSKTLEAAVFEMVNAANMAFALCPLLSLGAAEALTLNGTPRQQTLILPKLVSGEWTGTMNLTEPQAGSDLAAITTRAEPDGNGGYRLTGQKIFITWGDHEATPNICHLVLARLPDAPPGVKGISLFLATKRLVGEDGELGVANTVGPASLEHKMGIHGSPTCVMVFDGAQAELVGVANQGLAHMFIMMNAARLHVAAQGIGIAERAFQRALAFSQERRQGRAIWSADASAMLYDHPDVRRTLLLMKAKTEAGRGIFLTAALNIDIAHSAGSETGKAAAQARADMLIPIAKAWGTDIGVEVASLGVQVHGGMGFIEETGAAQHYRDARIAPIYEGTNGIQAIDLMGRKVRQNQGRVMADLCAEMHATAARLTGDLAGPGARLDAAITALESATEWLVQADMAAALTAATGYQKLAGDVIGGWSLARLALAAEGSEEPWLKAKADLLRIFAREVLALAPGLAAGIVEDAADLEAISAEALTG